MTSTLTTNHVAIKSSLKASIAKNPKDDIELTIEEVSELMKEMTINLEEDEIKMIFDKYDLKKNGKIKKSQLIEHFKGTNKKQSIRIQEFFLSNSEKAIWKLKKLRSKFEKFKDNDAMNDIDWIISVILTNSWETPDLNKAEEDDESMHDALKQYSHAEENITKRHDMSRVTMCFTKNFSVTSKKNVDNVSEVSAYTISNEEKLTNRRNTHLAR